MTHCAIGQLLALIALDVVQLLASGITNNENIKADINYAVTLSFIKFVKVWT